MRPPVVPLLTPPWGLRVCSADGVDLDLVHGWMNAAHVAPFWNQAWSRPQWAAELGKQLAGDWSRPCLVSLDGQSVAYLELYRPAAHPLAEHYPAQVDDVGVHIAIGSPDRIDRGLGSRLLRLVAEGLLAADPACSRVVAEPDVTNERSVRAFTRAGFAHLTDVRLPHKQAALMCFTTVESRPPIRHIRSACDA